MFQLKKQLGIDGLSKWGLVCIKVKDLFAAFQKLLA